MKAAHFFLLILFFECSAHAATPVKNPPLFWPEGKFIPIQVSYQQALADGLEFTITEFANSELPLYSPSMRDWKQTDKLTYRKSSVAFANNRNPAIKAGIAMVKSNDWLQSLDKDALNQYVASLRLQYPKRFVLKNVDTDFSPVPGSGFLIGKPYKMVHYQIVSEHNPNAVIEIRDFITQINDLTLVMSFESPSGLASHNSRMALTMLTSLSKLDDLE